MKTVRAATLAAQPWSLAPSTGDQCRRCGDYARNQPADLLWTIHNGAAFCPHCAGRRDQEQAAALAVPCERCGARAGSKCKNYLGQNKQTCPGRGPPPPATSAPPPVPVPARPVQPSLFD
jgi:hypothetical protein